MFYRSTFSVAFISKETSKILVKYTNSWIVRIFCNNNIKIIAVEQFRGYPNSLAWYAFTSKAFMQKQNEQM